MKRIIYIIMLVMSLASGVSCIEDGFTTSPSAQPEFSVDTLNMGVVFTETGTTTHKFVVYNRNSKGISISSISLSGANAELFRMNVDGFSGKSFSNVEIRANDSIYVLVEATLPANEADETQNKSAKIDFVTNGVTRSVVVAADGQDVNRQYATIIEGEESWTSQRPYQIYDSLVVAEGAKLTLGAGTRLYFHDGASLIVRGTMVARGTSEKPITLSGDRTGNVVTNISFDIMSKQWDGVYFTATSTYNELAYTTVRNTSNGVIVYGGEEESKTGLQLQNCVFTNSGGYSLAAVNADVKAYGCEFSDASSGVVYLESGNHEFNQCTFANYYLFTALGGPAIQLSHLSDKFSNGSELPYMTAVFSNSIIYGNGSDLSHGDLTGTQVYFKRCLLKSEGSDDDNFILCLWGENPLYYTVREDYVFDYRLKDESQAIGVGDVSLNSPLSSIDRYGKARGTAPDLGAYVYTPEEK
jgi:hypothetical protein